MSDDQIPGQLTIFDVLKPEEKNEKGDCSTCEYRTWLHRDGRVIQGCCYHGGNDGCHYEPRPKMNCITCGHYTTVVDAYTCKPLYKICNKPNSCYGDQVDDPETHWCELWEKVNDK